MLSVVMLMGLAIYYESNRHLTKGHYNFKIEPINKSRIRFDLIHLGKASQKENRNFRQSGSSKFGEAYNFVSKWIMNFCLV